MEKFLNVLLQIKSAYAGSYDNGFVNAFSKSAGLQTENAGSIESTVAFYITLALGFIGIILLILTLRAGALWMTSQGDKKIIDNSKKTILGCTIGLFLILSSYAISEFIITNINKAERNTFNQNTNATTTEPGTLTKTVCESNSECPQYAPYCTGKGWYNANTGYCNCCDDKIEGHKCNTSGQRDMYCKDTYGAGYLCDGVGNGINTACAKDCNIGDPNACPTGQVCKKTAWFYSHNICVPE